jgi:hypothetical protein
MLYKNLYLVYVLGPFENYALLEDIAFHEDMNVDNMTDEEKRGPFFYGYTFEKKMLKKFLYYRDKSRFYIKKIDVSDWGKEDVNDFERSNLMKEILMDELTSPAYKFKGAEPSNEYGDFIIHLPIVRAERQIIENTLEWYDDFMVSKFDKEMVKDMSVLVKCVTKEVLIWMKNSGILDLLGFIQLILFGETSFEEPCMTVDEINIFFGVYGELFELDKVFDD